jgi:putative transposase
MIDKQFKRTARAVSDLKAHLVLTTKYRKKIITPIMLKRLSEIIKEQCQKWGCDYIEFNGESDHIHLIFRYYPQLQVSKFVNSLKTVTSRLIRKEFTDELPYVYGRRHVFWNESYFIASCGGVTVEVLKKYVQNQGKNEKQRP